MMMQKDVVRLHLEYNDTTIALRNVARELMVARDDIILSEEVDAPLTNSTLPARMLWARDTVLRVARALERGPVEDPTPESESIAEYLSRTALTLQDLADRSGVAKSTIASIKSGTTATPRKSTLEKLAKALRVQPEAVREWNELG